MNTITQRQILIGLLGVAVAGGLIWASGSSAETSRTVNSRAKAVANHVPAAPRTVLGDTPTVYAENSIRLQPILGAVDKSIGSDAAFAAALAQGPTPEMEKSVRRGHGTALQLLQRHDR